MTDIETKIEDEDFTEELSDEALDRDGAPSACALYRGCIATGILCAGA